jgi:hypothetical protein
MSYSATLEPHGSVRESDTRTSGARSSLVAVSTRRQGVAHTGGDLAGS